jgi:hypothetical protein
MAAEWHRVGLERPHFRTRFRGQSESWVAPAQQETSLGTRGENFDQASEEGRNYLLQHLLELVMRISLGDCNPGVDAQDCQESIGMFFDILTARSCISKEHL